MLWFSRRAAPALTIGMLFALASCGGGGESSSLPAANPIEPQAATTLNASNPNDCTVGPVKAIQASPSAIKLAAGQSTTLILCDQFYTSFSLVSNSNTNLAGVTFANPSPPVNDQIYTQTVNVTAAAGQAGTATLIFKDKKGNRVSVTVTVTQPIGTPIDLGSNSEAGSNGPGQASVTLTTTAAAPAGSTLIVVADGFTDGVNLTCSDSASHTFTTDIHTQFENAVGICSSSNATLASGQTITAAWSACYKDCFFPTIHAFAVTGLANSPADQAAQGNQPLLGLALSSGPTPTTSQANELLVAAFSIFATDNRLLPNSLTLGTNGTQNNCAGTQSPTYISLGTNGPLPLTAAFCIVNATGEYTAQATQSGINDWGAVIATYKGGP